MPDHSVLLNHFSFVVFFSVMLGSAYQMVIQPGEFFAFIPRYFMGKGKFLAKLTSCGKCVAGWTALSIFPVVIPWSVVWFAPFLHVLAIATSLVGAGLISVYVGSRT